MWKCQKCKEQCEDTFDSCWNCGTGRDGSAPTEPFPENGATTSSEPSRPKRRGMGQDESPSAEPFPDRQKNGGLFMEGRSYKTAFTIAQIGEYLSWAVIVIAVLVGLSFMTSYGIMAGIGVMMIVGLPGFFLVYLSQLMLIFIDTENNTRQVMSEVQKTNSMLAETLGTMAKNLNELAKR